MFRRAIHCPAAGRQFIVPVAGSIQKKANNPLTHINSKQPDKVLFDRAMEAMKEAPVRSSAHHAADADQHLSGLASLWPGPS